MGAMRGRFHQALKQKEGWRDHHDSVLPEPQLSNSAIFLLSIF